MEEPENSRSRPDLASNPALILSGTVCRRLLFYPTGCKSPDKLLTGKLKGILRKWDSAPDYSNAFFIGGSLIIVAGALSRLGAGQDWGSSRLLYAESFRDMDSGQRASLIINANSSVSRLFLGLLSGIMLILIYALMAAMS